jgi:hypothetical protein
VRIMSDQGSEGDTDDQGQDVTDRTARLVDSAEPSIPIEVPEADLLEQSREADEDSVDPGIPLSTLLDEEASEADVLDQRREVPLDDDFYL